MEATLDDFKALRCSEKSFLEFVQVGPILSEDSIGG